MTSLKPPTLIHPAGALHSNAQTRSDGRAFDTLRPVEMIPNWVNAPLGSVLIRQGETWALCAVSQERSVPEWLSGREKGWLTASYAMLPGSTPRWTSRKRGASSGRTREIERLIGRSLRAAVDLKGLGERTLHVDCDILQADGGTRTAAVTGAWAALALALNTLCIDGELDESPMVGQIAAVSVGVVDGSPLLDLAYDEDVRAETDMNIVMNAEGRFVEIQGTAEQDPYSRSELDMMLDLAQLGIKRLLDAQMEVIHGA